MSTARCIAVAAALALLVFICAAAIQSKPSPFEPATCPGCEPVPYTPSEEP